MNIQQPTKKQYIKPELTAHGAMEELTRTHWWWIKQYYFGYQNCDSKDFGAGGSFS